MAEHQNINSFLQVPGSITKHSFILKGITTSSAGSASKLDLNGLLELLNITNDVYLQLKVFSALSAYLMFNKSANIDVIIKSTAVYDKINSVLSRGLPRKSTEALNFLSALLYLDADESSTTKKHTLAIYARNMTRVSGCLSAMCDMFTNCMMYHDTWKALCQCLAVACSGNEMNQSYCSHLIPVCIQKCSQVNIDVLLVLQSLLLNHSRNSNLFLDCDGVKIFTRELLHYDKCLQLLTTIMQCSKTSTLLIQQTNVLPILRDFLRLYGPNSQLGQKAIIIMNHISCGAKEIKTQHGNVTSNTIRANKLLVEKETEKIPVLENDLNANTDHDFEETKVLIQNVMKEVFKLKQSELHNYKNVESKSNFKTGNKSIMPSMASKQKLTNKIKQISNRTSKLTGKSTNEIYKHTKESNRRNGLHIESELSFSFLQNEEFQVPKNDLVESSRCVNNTQRLNFHDTQLNNTTFYETISDTKKNEKHTTTLKDFSPIYASTPKNTADENVNPSESTINSCKISADEIKQNKYKNLRMKRQKAKRETHKHKTTKNRSIGARFLGAINESCTTFVKTVKNIFSKKESSDNSRSSSSNSTETVATKDKRPSNTYSFMHYMRKRDAVLNNNWMKNKITDFSEFSVAESMACKTCDNTKVLKQKLTKDEFLKQTVKKLKLGINLYGCDFKKISKTMWPRETYMTPMVLYNLYRKLLRK